MCYALPVEGRLGECALRLVEFSLACDQSFPDQHLHALDRAFLDETVVLNDQYFANIVGIVEYNDVSAVQTIMRRLAVFIGEVREQRNRVPRTELTEQVKNKAVWQPRREDI